MDHTKINRVFPDLDKQLFKTIETRVDSFKESLEKSGMKMDLSSELKFDLIKIFLFSEFISSILIQNPGILKTLVESKDLFKSYSNHTYKATLERTIAGDMDVERVRELLLQVKVYEIIRIAWRDLTGKALLEETLCDLSNLADAMVDMVTTVIYEDLCKTYGVPCDHEGNFQGMIVLGMGKLGAGELNFSSDLDLIFAYPAEGVTNGENIISNDAFFTELFRRFLKFFSLNSQAMNFYRIDTRLRPYGDGGPLVMSSSVFEAYYQAQGREWERYAMIKARPIAGDIEAGLKLLKVLNPFIFRRYFDYGSFDSFRDMKHRITLQVKNKRLKHNIKLGAGGIREIEFFGQLFQLIRGGVEPKFQEPKILKILNLLQTHNCINEVTQKDLKDAYIFLRMVENRLQAYADRQTHDIPEKEYRRKILALSM